MLLVVLVVLIYENARPLHAFHFEVGAVESIVVGHFAVYAFTVRLGSLCNLHESALCLTHGFIIFVTVYSQRSRVGVSVAHFTVMLHYLVPSDAHGQQVVGYKLVDGVVLVFRVAVSAVRI